jgi:hypothetical protein
MSKSTIFSIIDAIILDGTMVKTTKKWFVIAYATMTCD